MGMTDEQLLDLIETKTPEELTLAEIDQLRQRLSESPMLRAAMSVRIEMEQYLAAALGRVNVSVDEIMNRAGNSPALRANPALPLLGWVLCLVLIGFVGLVLLLAVTVPPAKEAERQQAANREATSVAESTKPASEDPLPDPTDLVPDAAPATEPPAVPAVATQPATPTTPANPVAPAKPAEPKNPWDDLAGAEDRPRPSPAALFADVDQTIAPPRKEDLKQWFSEAPGLPHNISHKDYYGVDCGVLDGVWRLRAPLKPKMALRLTLAEFHNLQIHCWHGSEGVTLHYFENASQSWAAYRTTRKQNEAKPATIALIGTDEDRFWRTNPVQPTTLELRAEDGLLTLSRGDVRVLSVPFEGVAGEVYFDGHAVYRQIAAVGAAELPPEPAPQPVLVDSTQPAKLRWSGHLPEGADFQKLPDGRVELTAEKNAQPAWVSVALPHRESVCEMVVQLDEPQPGSGLFLGDDQGPRYQVGFFKEAHHGQTSFFALGPGDNRFDSNHDLDNVVAPMSLPRPWFRLVFGCGTFKVWTSLDGIHWGRAFDPLVNQQAPYTHLGLYCLAGQPRKSIKLRHVQLRELATLSGLAPMPLRRKALAMPQAADMTEWLDAVLASQPPDADSVAWRRACAIRTLAAGTTAALGTPLLDSLLDEALEDHKPVAVQIKLLDEAALLCHTWDDPSAALRFSQRYQAIGYRAHREGQTRPCSLIEHAQRTAPIWSRQVYNFLPDSLMRIELLELTQAADWAPLHDFCREQRFWRHLPGNAPTPPGMIDWADSLARAQLPKQPGRGGPTTAVEWRHPLLVELSKEGYNVLAEFRAALDGHAYRDACQIISTSTENGMLGLLPDARDPELLVSLPGAVSLAMRDHPGLRTTMSEQFGALGRLRIRQSIAENNVAAVEASTIQFLGTEAAAEAHLWLADRSLASGAFAHALGQYRQAERTAAADLRGRIAASQQLAAALMGQNAGEPITRSVTFGDTQLSAADLQALVADLRQHRLADNLIGRGEPAGLSSGSAPPASGFETAARSRFDGDGGDSPQNVPGENNLHNIDWVARQLALVVDGARLILSNRFQLSAYDLNSGALQWRSELGGEHGHTHDWPLMPMRPLNTATRIFVRRLHKAGPVLSCFNSVDGKLMWTSKIEPEKWVVADPLLIQDELFALVMTRLEQEFTLSLVTYDPQTGAVLSARPLTRFRENWWQERTCQVLAMGDRLIVTAGGAVLSCDLLGQVHWVRRQTWVPPSIERSWLEQNQEPPLLADGRLLVAQPSVRSVVALEPESGRLLWNRVLPTVRRMIGVIGDRLIVETDPGFVALDMQSGKPLWYHDADKRLDAVLCRPAGDLMYTQAEPVRGENNLRPALVWIDPATGRTKARTALEALKHERPKFGPLLTVGDRRWAFFGRGEQDATRDIVELTPKGAALTSEPQPLDFGLWNRSTDPLLTAAAALVLPQWTLIGGRIDAQTGIQPEWQQEKIVLNTLPTSGARPLSLVRRVAVPVGGNPRLSLRVGNDPGGKWKLDVRADERSLLVQSIDPAFTGGAWKDLEVDLKPFGGQNIWLIVRQVEDGPQPYAKWKRLEVVY